MKKILLSITFLFSLSVSYGQLFLEQYDLNVTSGVYDFGYIFGCPGGCAPITESKPSSSELAYDLTSVGGTGVYNHGVGHGIYNSVPANSTIDVTGQAKVRMRVKSTTAVTLRVDLEDTGGDATNSAPVTVSIAGDNTYSIIEFTGFVATDYQADPVDLTMIRAIQMYFNADLNPAVTGTVTVDWFYIGNGTDPTAVSDAAANIASTKLYPNPVSDLANVELELKSPSAVKVVVSDVMGKEVMTSSHNSATSFNAPINVANLNKGIYNVTYYLDGAVAKTELLMVK